jgi:hypothetical protein
VKKTAVLALLLGAGLAQTTSAATITFEIKDLQTSLTYTDNNVAQTFAGTGFVGMYNVVANGEPAFAHLLGIEDTDYSRTNMQVGIAGLAGTTIVSATLSFQLLDGCEGCQQTIEGTAYRSSGALGYLWDAPALNYGFFAGTAAPGANAYDVTSLLAASVLAGDSWFGMHLAGTDNEYIWTYTLADRDAAVVRLDVEYVPEPGTLALIGTGLATMLARRRRRS